MQRPLEAREYEARNFEVRSRIDPPPPPVYYYYKGEEYTAITGGWVAGFLSDTGSQSENSDHLFVSATFNAATAWRSYVTQSAVDVTELSNVKCEVTTTNLGTDKSFLLKVVKASDGSGTDGAFTIITTTGTKATVTVDVSGLTGYYYLVVMVVSDVSAQTVTAEVYKVWGEA